MHTQKQQFLVWSHGKSSNNNNNHYNQCQAKIVTCHWTSEQVQNIYIKDNGVLYLIDGRLFKDGTFNYEGAPDKNSKAIKNNDNTFPTLLNMLNINKMKDSSDAIVAVAEGLNHFVLRTSKGNVYTFGDNYYGQLGLNNCFIAKVYEPHQVAIKNIKSIWAYENNSFALDNNNKLWVWGSTKFLGGNFKTNSFKPIQILTEYLVSKIKVSDDRLIAYTREDADIFKRLEGDDDNVVEEIKYDESEKVEKKEEDDVEDISENLVRFLEEINSHIDGILGRLVVTDIKPTYDDNIIQSETRAEMQLLANIRKKVLCGNKEIRMKGFENVWSDILLLISKKSNEAKIDVNGYSDIDLFMAVFLGTINNTFTSTNHHKLVARWEVKEREMKKLLSEINTSDLNNKAIDHYSLNVKVLLDYLIKYKKIEMLIHKMAGHQFLLKSYHFTNVITGMEQLLNSTENVDKKLYIVDKTFANLESLILRLNESLEDIKVVFDNLSLFDVNNLTDSNVEKFLYKHIIESTLYIRDLWNLLIYNVRARKLTYEKQQQFLLVTNKFKHLSGIQKYLNSIDISRIFTVSNNKMTDIKTGIIIVITEIDGVICRLEEMLKDYLDTKNDSFSKQMVVMYGTSLLDNAYQKKQMLHLLVSGVNIYIYMLGNVYLLFNCFLKFILF